MTIAAARAHKVLTSALAFAVTGLVIASGVRTASASITTAGPPPALGVLGATGLTPGARVESLLVFDSAGDYQFLVHAESSSRLDRDLHNGLQLTIESCSTGWLRQKARYRCAGQVSTDVGVTPVVGRHPLAVGTITRTLRLTLSLPSSGGNEMMGLTSALRYRVAS